jgi:hypothetical protein
MQDARLSSLRISLPCRPLNLAMSMFFLEQPPEPEGDPDDRPLRRHATDVELAMLTAAILRFYSEPERSVERAMIHREIAGLLQGMYECWTTRRVCLWFGGNEPRFCIGPCSSAVPADSPRRFDRPL